MKQCRHQQLHAHQPMKLPPPLGGELRVQGGMSRAHQVGPSHHDHHDHTLCGHNTNTAQLLCRLSLSEGWQQSNKGKVQQMSPQRSQPARPAEQHGKSNTRRATPEPITAQVSQWATDQAQWVLHLIEAGAYSHKQGASGNRVIHSRHFGLILGLISRWILIYFEAQIELKFDFNSATLCLHWISTTRQYIGVPIWQTTSPRSRSSLIHLRLCLQLLRDSSLWKPCIRPYFSIWSLSLSKMQSHPTPLQALVPRMTTLLTLRTRRATLKWRTIYGAGQLHTATFVQVAKLVLAKFFKLTLTQVKICGES